MENALPAMIAGRYRVLRELGRGGMGAVYVVEHVHTGDTLAMKVLLSHVGAHPELVERFKREARAPARIKSDHVVRVTDADVAPELGGAPFLVMELLQGEDLEKVVRRGPLSPSDVLKYLAQAARALEKAHALGIVHRDLKPENLFLHTREDGSTILKIIDFGISRMTAEGAGDAGLGGIASAGMTRSGVMLGTPYYMSPEQARGQTAQAGPPTDIWSLGIIANRLLTGMTYWTAQSIGDLMVQIIAAPLPPPSSYAPWLPPAFDAWFARTCERDPSRRWSSVTEQVDALAQALGVAAAGGTLRVDTGMGHGPYSASAPSGSSLAAAPGSVPGALGSGALPGAGGRGGVVPAVTPPPLAATGPNIYRTVSEVRAPRPGSRGAVGAIAAVLAVVLLAVGGRAVSSGIRARAAASQARALPSVTAPPATPSSVPATSAERAPASAPVPPPSGPPPPASEVATAATAQPPLPPQPNPKSAPRERVAHAPSSSTAVAAPTASAKGFNPTAP